MSATSIAELANSYLDQLALAGRSERTVDHYRRGLDDFMAYAEAHSTPPDAAATKITRGLITGYQLHLAERRHVRVLLPLPRGRDAWDRRRQVDPPAMDSASRGRYDRNDRSHGGGITDCLPTYIYRQMR